MKKIIVSGGWGYGNLGDNAILSGLLGAIDDLMGKHYFRILSFSTEEIEHNHGMAASVSIHRIMENERSFPNWLQRRVPFLRKSFRSIEKLAPEQMAEIGGADLLVLSGGGYFNGAWPSMADSQYAMIRRAKESGAKIVILGQSIGPFNRGEINGRLAEHLQMVDMIAVRDQVSYEICKDALGSEANLRLTADLANLLPNKERKVLEDNHSLPARLGVMVQYPRAKNSKHSTRTRTRSKTKDDYFAEVSESIVRFARGKSIEVDVIPSTTWDRQACKDVTAALQREGCKARYQQPENVGEFISLCQGVDLMFSTNMHPLIIASTAAIPLVALSYHFKTDHFMTEIGLEDRVLDIDRFTTMDVLDLLESTWANRVALSDVVRSKQKGLRDLSAASIDMLREYIAP